MCIMSAEFEARSIRAESDNTHNAAKYSIAILLKCIVYDSINENDDNL